MKQWKIADFGLTSHGTTTGASPTVAGRGTSGYRAPELFRRDDNYTFNKKVDIWSIGCILFELCTGTKAFQDDWITLEFAHAKKKWSVEIPGICRSLGSWLCNIIQECFDLDPKKRLSAECLRRALADPPTETLTISTLSGNSPRHDFAFADEYGRLFVSCNCKICGYQVVIGDQCGNCGTATKRVDTVSD